MTTHLDDSVISAVVDGEADAHDVEHLEQCPECQRRLAMFEAAAAAVAAPPSPSAPGQADLAVRRALASGTDGDGGPWRTTASEPPGRSPHRQVLAAAAVAVIIGVIVGVVALVRNNPSARRSASSAAGPLQSSPGPQRGTAPPSGAAASGAAGSAVEPSQGNAEISPLGEFSDPGQLASALRAALAGAHAAPSAAARPSTRAGCGRSSAVAAGVPVGTLPRLSTTVVWRGQPSVVSVYEKADGHLSAAVVATRGCATRLVLPL